MFDKESLCIRLSCLAQRLVQLHCAMSLTAYSFKQRMLLSVQCERAHLLSSIQQLCMCALTESTSAALPRGYSAVSCIYKADSADYSVPIYAIYDCQVSGISLRAQAQFYVTPVTVFQICRSALQHAP
eukprot:3868-Heterococcus_DN1.PRE.5